MAGPSLDRLRPPPAPEGAADVWFHERMKGAAAYGLRVVRTICSEQTPYQRIELFESAHHGKVLVLDGCVMLTELDEFVYHEMLAHVAAQTVPSPRRAVVVGGGDGGVVRELLKYPGLEVTLAEIDERVVRISQEHLPGIGGALDDPRVTLHFGDGASFLADLPAGSVDLIAVDSTDPVGAAGSLVTEEFYATCLRALGEDGVLVAQTQTPFYFAGDVREIHATLGRAFPQVFMYWAVIPAYVGFLWTFAYASKRRHPLEHLAAAPDAHRALGTAYWTADMHRGAFALPPFVQACLPAGHPQRSV